MNPLLWQLNPVFRIIALVLGVLFLAAASDGVFRGLDEAVMLTFGIVLAGLGAGQLWQFGIRRAPRE